MHPSTRPSPQRQRQRGAALIIALIFLLIMTVLGVSGIQNSTMETRMAGNSADRNRSFQASEFALQAAKDNLKTIMETSTWQSTFTSDTNDAYYRALDDNCDAVKPWSEAGSTTAWSDTNSAEASDFPTQTPALEMQPRYMIGLDTVLNPNLDCYSDNTVQGFANTLGSVAPKAASFTMTAIGYGAQPNTRTRLQETISYAY